MIKQTKEFGLTSKLYVLTVLVAMSIHTVGIWLITPLTNPLFIKNVFMGGLLLILLISIGYFIFKPTHEQPDERFYMNLAKSASIMFVVTIIILLVLTGFIFYGTIMVVHAGFLLITIGMILLSFGIVYHTFESMA